MDEKKGVIKEFFRLVTTAFTCFILGISIVGWFVGDSAGEVSALFDLGGIGLSYQMIFGGILFCAINSFLSLFITNIFKKLMVLWQMIILMFACLVATGVLIAEFGWIPVDSWRAWLWFAGSFVGMFIAIAVIMIIYTIRANKRLEKQLSDYKAKLESKEKNND